MPLQRHQPTPLSDYSVKSMQNLADYNAGSTLAPVKRVQKETDSYYIYNLGQQFRRPSTLRNHKEPAKRIDFTELSTGSYSLKLHSLALPISEVDRAADPAVNPDLDAIDELTRGIFLDREVEIATRIFTTTGAGQGVSLTDGLYDQDTITSSPITDLHSATAAILRNTGRAANYAFMGFRTFQILSEHQDFLDRIKWTSPDGVTEAVMAKVIGLDKIAVNKVVNRTTNEGISATTAFLFDTKVLLGYNDYNPGLRSMNGAIQFTGIYGDMAPQVRKYKDEAINCDVLELNWMYDIRVIQSLSMYMINTCHA